MLYNQFGRINIGFKLNRLNKKSKKKQKIQQLIFKFIIISYTSISLIV